MIYKARVVYGYFEKVVEVNVDRKLKNMPYAQAGVRIDEYGAITLVSYETEVINIDPMGWLTCTGTYSASTRKHIGAFLKEYAPNITYQDAKRCYENNETIQIYTGAIAKR